MLGKPRYRGAADFRHDAPLAGTGVLVVNLGTPDAPTPRAVRRYLGEFLADPRVIEAPRWLWRTVLHGVILRIRPRPVAKAYRRIWTEAGAPLLTHSHALTEALRQRLGQSGDTPVELGMRYGNPSIDEALERLRAARVRRLLVLPLYPQYSGTTTGATFDALAASLARWRWLPALRMVDSYHEHSAYIDALARQIRAHRDAHGRRRPLLFSFHGLPRRYLDAGDPYFCHCHKTARLVAERLDLADDAWAVAFQSRFGREPWLQPYTDEVLSRWPAEGIDEVDVCCPGFPADCLETLEEVAIGYRELFLERGGKELSYIPALNDSEAHVTALQRILEDAGSGWPGLDPSAPSEHDDPMARERRYRALTGGG